MFLDTAPSTAACSDRRNVSLSVTQEKAQRDVVKNDVGNTSVSLSRRRSNDVSRNGSIEEAPQTNTATQKRLGRVISRCARIIVGLRSKPGPSAVRPKQGHANKDSSTP